MMMLYCHAHHSGDALCVECHELFDYAMTRLDNCPFQETKPTCAKCRVHCYTPVMRTKILGVMRYSGPRMLFSHPLLTLRHILDGFKTPSIHT
jgi:hypothetical protein